MTHDDFDFFFKKRGKSDLYHDDFSIDVVYTSDDFTLFYKKKISQTIHIYIFNFKPTLKYKKASLRTTSILKYLQ